MEQRRGLLILSMLVFAVASLFAFTPQGVSAGTQVIWGGNGSENLPCKDGGHWILSPAQGITSATLTVGGVQYVMSQGGEGQGAFHGESVGSVTQSTTATVVYEGSNDKAFLKLSNCLDEKDPPKDVCPNLDGGQAHVPDGYELKDGKCVPVKKDVCPNIDGIQTEVPDGYFIDYGKCLKDVCPNLDGGQAHVPDGYELKDGKCVKDEKHHDKHEYDKHHDKDRKPGVVYVPVAPTVVVKQVVISAPAPQPKAVIHAQSPIPAGTVKISPPSTGSGGLADSSSGIDMPVWLGIPLAFALGIASLGLVRLSRQSK
jgi:hypothetical protein